MSSTNDLPGHFGHLTLSNTAPAALDIRTFPWWEPLWADGENWACTSGANSITILHYRCCCSYGPNESYLLARRYECLRKNKVLAIFDASKITTLKVLIQKISRKGIAASKSFPYHHQRMRFKYVWLMMFSTCAPLLTGLFRLVC